MEMVEGGRWCEADLEVLVDNAWRTHERATMDGEVARGATTRAAACYTGTPVRPLGPFRVTGMSYARARQRPTKALRYPSAHGLAPRRGRSRVRREETERGPACGAAHRRTPIEGSRHVRVRRPVYPQEMDTYT